VKNYTDNVLQLKDPMRYFQAGVMVFNIYQMRKSFKKRELVTFAEQREYMYVDQDVLNVKCKDRVYTIDMKWNVMTDCNRFRMDGIIKRAPKSIYDEYMKSRANPFIIHYAGNEKPWNSPLSDMADVFWVYCRRTPFYEAVLWRMSDIVSSQCQRARAPKQGSMIRRLADILCPKGTRRREFFKMLYYRFL